MRFVLSLILVGSALLSSTYQAHAQSNDVTVSVEDADTSAFPTIRIRVSVRDQYGVPIRDLSVEHFEIVEDGAAAYAPTAVEAETNPDAQVSLAIVVDLYRTLQGQPIESAQQATQDLLTELLDEPDDADRAAFVGVRQGLSTDPSEIDETYEVAFTNDRNKLLNVVNFLHERVQTSGPGTPLYDAVVKAVRMAEASEPVAHRAVIVMTDGEDRGSVSQDSDTIQRASNARTPVFTVGLSNSGLDEQYLMRLAENSGGTYQAAETPEDLSALFSNVLSMLRTQYVVSYESGLPQDGQAHSLLVRVRTPTQLEGFQEYRVTMPGSVAEETEQQATPTAEDAPPGSSGEAEPEPEEDEGALATARDWVQDNLLLAGLAFGVLALLFLALVIGAVIVMRRRRATAEESVAPLDVPDYPAAPEFGFDNEPFGATVDANEEGFAFGATESPPPPPETMLDEERAFGAAPPPPQYQAPSPAPPPSPRYEGPSAAPPGFPQPDFQTSSADRTRILQRGPTMSMVGLLIDRDQPASRLDVAKPTVMIGRSQESDVVVDHNTVSRQHAAIKLEEGQFRLYDMGSTNGTFVGDERVREPVALQDGAVVKFGDKAFVFKVISLDT
jgi:VWFA-related protein